MVNWFLDSEQKSHWESLRIRDGVVGTPPEKTEPKKEGKSRADRPTVNENLAEAKANLPNLRK